jgi:transcriptional regulator with GAF, ATPase, and Fis domain
MSAARFQGAVHDRTGKLEIANGGTLFLDEVSEIPIELQGKILKTLRDKTLERLGDNRTNKINVRVIAAIDQGSRGLRQERELREDLYFYPQCVSDRVPALA